VHSGEAYDRPANWMSNLLCGAYGHCRPPLTGGEGGAKKLPHTPLPGKGRTAQALLHLHPNPAGTWVAMDYDLLVPPHDAAILIRDMTGRDVHRITLREQQQQVVWDTRQAAPGSYTVSLQHKGRQLRTEKLIIRP
jgi:hypothetical protein